MNIHRQALLLWCWVSLSDLFIKIPQLLPNNYWIVSMEGTTNKPASVGDILLEQIDKNSVKIRELEQVVHDAAFSSERLNSLEKAIELQQKELHFIQTLSEKTLQHADTAIDTANNVVSHSGNILTGWTWWATVAVTILGIGIPILITVIGKKLDRKNQDSAIQTINKELATNFSKNETFKRSLLEVVVQDKDFRDNLAYIMLNLSTERSSTDKQSIEDIANQVGGE